MFADVTQLFQIGDLSVFYIKEIGQSPNFRFTTESISNIAFENILEAFSNDRTTRIKP